MTQCKPSVVFIEETERNAQVNEHLKEIRTAILEGFKEQESQGAQVATVLLEEIKLLKGEIQELKAKTHVDSEIINYYVQSASKINGVVAIYVLNSHDEKQVFTAINKIEDASEDQLIDLEGDIFKHFKRELHVQIVPLNRVKGWLPPKGAVRL